MTGAGLDSIMKLLRLVARPYLELTGTGMKGQGPSKIKRTHSDIYIYIYLIFHCGGVQECPYFTF